MTADVGRDVRHLHPVDIVVPLPVMVSSFWLSSFLSDGFPGHDIYHSKAHKSQLLTAIKRDLYRRTFLHEFLKFCADDEIPVPTENYETSSVIFCQTSHFFTPILK